jgi:hypothetical protein
MNRSFARKFEKDYMASNTEVDSKEVSTSLHAIWISNLGSNKKIRIKRISDDRDPRGGYPFNLSVCYTTKQDKLYYVYDMDINPIPTTEKMHNIG